MIIVTFLGKNEAQKSFKLKDFMKNQIVQKVLKYVLDFYFDIISREDLDEHLKSHPSSLIALNNVFPGIFLIFNLNIQDSCT